MGAVIDQLPYAQSSQFDPIYAFLANIDLYKYHEDVISLGFNSIRFFVLRLDPR